MKLLSLLTIITFLMTPLGGDPMARVKRHPADNAAFQQQEDVLLLEFLYEVGKTYDCFFTIEKPVVDPKNWTVFDQQHTVQKGESTDGKTSNFQTRIQGPRRPPGSDWNEDRRPSLSSASAQ